MTPTKIGRYQVRGELGRGGMATVYHAYDPTFEREVAVKVLPRELLHDPQFKVRFEREAKMVARLEHAAIVPVYDVGEEDGQPYFVMRYMNGGSLADRMKGGQMPLNECVRIIQRVAAALDYAHVKGVIHRDLKPGNILFDETDDPYISDFGIAKFVQSETNLTGSSIIGTPAYMSPEQAQGEELDGRSDLYSLAIIFFEMLSSRPPYEANTPLGLAFKHVAEPIPHILDLRPDLPVSTEMVIEKALAKKRDDRFSSAGSFANAMDDVLRGEIPDLNPTRPMATKLHKTVGGAPGKTQAQPKPVTILSGVGVLALLAFAGWALFHPSDVPLAASSPTPLAATTAPATEPPPPTDTPTPTETAVPLGVGGADKLAFINGNNIWVTGIDGLGLVQLTNDAQPKARLQWLPGGERLVYIDVLDNCARVAAVESQKIETLMCLDEEKTEFFEGFDVSPDGKQVAITLNRELFIVPFDPAKLAGVKLRNDLLDMNGCLVYSKISSKWSRWSSDGNKLAVLFALGTGNRVADTIRVIDISRCSAADPLRLDEFPGTRFTMEGYSNQVLPDFGWDGGTRFLLHTFKRNDGYGELYLYDSVTGQARRLNPVEGKCCYRDARFSPDGKYIIFMFQDFAQGANSETKMYYVPLQSIENGEIGPALPFPFQFFSNPREKPQPVLRPAVP